MVSTKVPMSTHRGKHIKESIRRVKTVNLSTIIGITGGSGYIGTWLTKKLLENGERIRIIDILPPSAKLTSKVDYVKADINNEDSISRAIHGCDTVYHLAATVSKFRGVEDRRHCIQTNVIGTLNVLEACRRYDVCRLIYMGTSEILGEPCFTPTDERHSRRPKTTYGITKCAGEDLCYEFYNAYNLNVVMPRLYMVYGVKDIRPIKYTNVIIKFVLDALHDIRPVAFSGCLRTFLYITDCIDALFILRDRGFAGEIYNICGRKEEVVTMEELAQKIIWLSGKDFEPIIREPPSSDTKVKLPSGYKAYVELSWLPKISLDEGLKRVVDWVKGDGF